MQTSSANDSTEPAESFFMPWSVLQRGCIGYELNQHRISRKTSSKQTTSREPRERARTLKLNLNTWTSPWLVDMHRFISHCFIQLVIGRVIGWVCSWAKLTLCPHMWCLCAYLSTYLFIYLFIIYLFWHFASWSDQRVLTCTLAMHETLVSCRMEKCTIHAKLDMSRLAIGTYTIFHTA